MATTKYPIPTFHFTVAFGGSHVDFTEVSGLSKSIKNIDYRGGANKNFLPIRLPGLPEVQNITLKKGIFAQDSELYAWLTQGVENRNPNDVDRRDLTISLMGADHQPVVVWTISQAWPIKVDGPTLNSTGNEIAVETIELCHEGIDMQTV